MEIQRENKENHFEDKDQTDIPDLEQFYKVGKQWWEPWSSLDHSNEDPQVFYMWFYNGVS